MLRCDCWAVTAPRLRSTVNRVLPGRPINRSLILLAVRPYSYFWSLLWCWLTVGIYCWRLQLTFTDSWHFIRIVLFGKLVRTQSLSLLTRFAVLWEGRFYSFVIMMYTLYQRYSTFYCQVSFSVTLERVKVSTKYFWSFLYRCSVCFIMQKN